MRNEKIVLAGGGHSHVLLLRQWAMNPKLRPLAEITLINRGSTTLYSGMIPGLISGHYSKKQLEIDLRFLARKSGVALVIAEIIGLDLVRKKVLLADRPPKEFNILSLDVGAEIKRPEEAELKSGPFEVVPIKPLENALDWLREQDRYVSADTRTGFTVVGAGLAGVEVVLALRRRWPSRKLYLSAYPSSLSNTFQKVLKDSSIELVSSNQPLESSALLCTGSKSPGWLALSGLSVDPLGRVFTSKTLQSITESSVFAVGDCAVIRSSPRPPSGVWAVRSAKPLGINLKLLLRGRQLKEWEPQKDALKLIGFQKGLNSSSAIAMWGGFVVGPSRFLWWLKKTIDLHFMSLFDGRLRKTFDSSMSFEIMECRGCASKLASSPLKAALHQAGLSSLGSDPEDAVEIDPDSQGGELFQSVDGFPALVSDSWLNGRITALHASSDLWASGAEVVSAQALIGLPSASKEVQQELLSQTLQGIQSALKPQGAKLIGGHTYEVRSIPPKIISLGLEVALSVNGKLTSGMAKLKKGLIQHGDALLISRPLGTGVLFAAEMFGKAAPSHLDFASKQLSFSQYHLFMELRSFQEQYLTPNPVHACTDVTGFGLLGHLGEMLDITSRKLRLSGDNSSIRVHINAEKIPSLPGALDLLQAGYCSSLAPANRSFWSLLSPRIDQSGLVSLVLGKITPESSMHKAIKELIVDPQTCGPLMISCEEDFADALLVKGNWHKIGNVFYV
ncbi:selenide, water dikinase SelD [Prochlorococcus sp. MIT 1341]|uniref:selenide, water dikinase SelD n=1 Tax=Prochlorococcus sp. MIT 1341 TaxID=3096221 RepID=UPI002A75AC59|nr:selenide, water dikinase SelD [Prochlorococcus sp. MIT 1341]